MNDPLSLFIKRFAVLLPGIGLAYLAASDVYPLFDRRLPAWVAVVLTYVVMAYIIVPAAMRLIHLLSRPRHVPLYCTTPDGFASDPVNIGIIGTRTQLTEAMEAAGWHKADNRTLGSLIKMIASVVLKRPYPNAPFSNLYLFGRSQDIGFQIPVDGTPSHRHHVRFWGCVDVRDPHYREHTVFWKRYHRSPLPGQLLWLGAASKDIGIGIIKHNAQVTHMIHHDTNAERDLIVKQLKAAGKVKRLRTRTIGKPYTLENRVFSGFLNSDGKIKIVTLRA